MSKHKYTIGDTITNDQYYSGTIVDYYLGIDGCYRYKIKWDNGYTADLLANGVDSLYYRKG